MSTSSMIKENFVSDSHFKPSCCGLFAEMFFLPLAFCGQRWQRLHPSSNESLNSTCQLGQKAILMSGIALSSVPALIGSLLKSQVNSSLDKYQNCRICEFEMSPKLQSKYEALRGKSTDSDAEIAARWIECIREHPELSKIHTISVNKHNVSFEIQEFGVRRPNGNELWRNMRNSFLPLHPRYYDSRQTAVLADFLFGIKSGKPADYQAIQKHLNYSTRIELDLSGDSNKFVLKIFY